MCNTSGRLVSKPPKQRRWFWASRLRVSRPPYLSSVEFWWRFHKSLGLVLRSQAWKPQGLKSLGNVWRGLDPFHFVCGVNCSLAGVFAAIKVCGMFRCLLCCFMLSRLSFRSFELPSTTCRQKTINDLGTCLKKFLLLDVPLRLEVIRRSSSESKPSKEFVTKLKDEQTSQALKAWPVEGFSVSKSFWWAALVSLPGICTKVLFLFDFFLFWMDWVHFLFSRFQMRFPLSTFELLLQAPLSMSVDPRKEREQM